MLSAMETLKEEPLPEILHHEDKMHHPTGDTIILNVHAPSNKIFKTKQKLWKPKRERDKSEITVGGLNTDFSVTGRRSRQKSLKIEKIWITWSLSAISRTLYQTIAGNTLLSCLRFSWLWFPWLVLFFFAVCVSTSCFKSFWKAKVSVKKWKTYKWKGEVWV